MKPSSSAWERLIAAARQTPDVSDLSAPYGFSTRVAALALAQTSAAPSLVRQFSLRALGIACIFSLLCVAFSYRSVISFLDDDPIGNTTDPVSQIQIVDIS